MYIDEVTTKIKWDSKQKENHFQSTSTISSKLPFIVVFGHKVNNTTPISYCIVLYMETVFLHINFTSYNNINMLRSPPPITLLPKTTTDIMNISFYSCATLQAIIYCRELLVVLLFTRLSIYSTELLRRLVHTTTKKTSSNHVVYPNLAWKYSQQSLI